MLGNLRSFTDHNNCLHHVKKDKNQRCILMFEVISKGIYVILSTMLYWVSILIPINSYKKLSFLLPRK